MELYNMIEALQNIFVGGDFWAILIKVLLTALLSALIGLVGTIIGRAISKHKNSKIYKYAETCVKAAEGKYPNEGTKMGPQKMQYVMDQLAIKFPRIKENAYLYNIAEAAVFELNKERELQAAIEEFEQKYGEKPIAVQEQEELEEGEDNIVVEDTVVEEVESNVTTTNVEETTTKLTSF